MTRFKQWRVRRHASSCWWQGVHDGFAGMRPNPMKYSEGPRWWNDVRRIAYDAGMAYAERVLEQQRESRFPRPLVDDIPADVLADCYAEASK